MHRLCYDFVNSLQFSINKETAYIVPYLRPSEWDIELSSFIKSAHAQREKRVCVVCVCGEGGGGSLRRHAIIYFSEYSGGEGVCDITNRCFNVRMDLQLVP